MATSLKAAAASMSSRSIPTALKVLLGSAGEVAAALMLMQAATQKDTLACLRRQVGLTLTRARWRPVAVLTAR